MKESNIVLFKTSDGVFSMPVRIGEDSVWLTVHQMADLFQKVVKSYSAALDLLDGYDHQAIGKPSTKARSVELTYEECRKFIDDMKFAGTSLSINTVGDYLNCFRRLFLINDTPPFSTFLRSPVRIKQSAKRHLSDPSLAAALLGATEKMLLRDRRTFGFLFEALAVRDLEVYADSLGAKFYHYQDYHGNEFDGVIQFKDGDWNAFEVKLGHDQIEEAAAELVRTAALFTHNPPKSLAVIVGTTGDAYRRPDARLRDCACSGECDRAG